MTIKAKPKTFSPTGLSDAEDGNNVFEGACSALVNLIPKPSTRNLWVPRPAKTVMTEFPGFNNPQFISALLVVGNTVYGMVATDRNPGKDEPFMYNILSGVFTTITGVTNPNTPASPVASGAWTPPIIELVGTRVIVTHLGFTGAGGLMFGWIDISNPAVPVWNAGNTTTTPLPFVPIAVANYQGSAVFAVREAAYFTNPLTLVVAATSVLTFNDNVEITAFKTLGFNTEAGGIVQALIVFKSSTAFQVKGSFFSLPLSTITSDAMNYGIGTESPLSLVDTPFGAGGIFPDGLRVIDLEGTFTPPIGVAGDGVNVPFLNALVPSRIAAACNASVFRVCVQNGGVATTPNQEYWLHLNREPKIWSGPHTFVPSLMQPYKTKFITSQLDTPGALFLSEVFPSTTTTYDELGAQMQWQMSTVMLPDEGWIGVYNFNEMTINMALDPVMISWTAYIINPDGQQYDNVVELVTGTTPVWDAAIWDQDLWDGVSQALTPRRIDWTKDITTSRAQIVLTGGAAGAVIIGDIRFMKGEYQYVPRSGI